MEAGEVGEEGSASDQWTMVLNSSQKKIKIAN